jgi:hypothetical protein
MNKQTPTRSQRSNKKATSPEEVPSVDQVDDQPTEATPSMKRTKIGEPTIGRSPDFVKTVGLGNLTVITANGKRNYT